MTEDGLWKAAVEAKDDAERANICINRLAYLDVPLLGDLRSEWDIRIHGKIPLMPQTKRV